MTYGLNQNINFVRGSLFSKDLYRRDGVASIQKGLFSRNSCMNTLLTVATIPSHASMVVIDMIHAHCGSFIACINIKKAAMVP